MVFNYSGFEFVSSFGFRFSDFSESYDSGRGCFAVVPVKQPGSNFYSPHRVVSNFQFFKKQPATLDNQALNIFYKASIIKV